MYRMDGLVNSVLASYPGGSWIKFWGSLFLSSDKTLEYSEIYHEQLTSEHFLPYNYRSFTLPAISRNIGRLLRQCSARLNLVRLSLQSVLWCGKEVRSLLCPVKDIILKIKTVQQNVDDDMLTKQCFPRAHR
jgi:hypothetical protein